MSEAGFPVSCRIVRQLLKQQGFVRRQSQKKKSFKQHPERNPQFENIAALKAKYLAAGHPVLSMKFLLNNCLYCANAFEVLKALGKSMVRKRMAAHMAAAPCWVMR